jgi:sugar lactone lactonase YvrE
MTEAIAATGLQAQLMRPLDDVATALVDLPAGVALRLRSGAIEREVVLREPVAAGHKFAVRDLAAGLRVRKYGEFIGRTIAAVPAGAWLHLHNLETAARHAGSGTLGWLDRAKLPHGLRALGSARCSVGENPLYDIARNRLYWIDVRETPAIHALDVTSGAELHWPMREDIGSIALAGGTRLLAGLRSGFALFDTADASLLPLHDPEPHLPANRLNDGRCDPAGRYWCGSMNPESASADGSVYVLEPDGRCRHVLGDLLTPNGIAWSPEGDRMYLADTRRGLIWCFGYDVRDGRLGERRVFADLGALPGGPDGATVDEEGFLWSAQFDGGCVIRFAPDGRIDRLLRLPVARPTACGFGGDDWRTLFVTTGTRGLDAHALREQPLAGRVLALDVGVRGLPPVRFEASALRTPGEAAAR